MSVRRMLVPGLVFVFVLSAAVSWGQDLPGSTNSSIRPYVPLLSPKAASLGVISPPDARLALGGGEATIEFWMMPGAWTSGNADAPIYPVVSNLRTTRTASGDTLYAPRYAIYFDNGGVFVQVGETLTYAEFYDAAAKSSLKDHARIYFVFTFDDQGVLVYANHRQCAKLPRVRLTAPGADAGGADRVLFGGRPPVGAADPVAVTTGGDTLQIHLAASLRTFDGQLGGLRIWERELDPKQFVPSDARDASLLQRGTNQMKRSLAFPDVYGDGSQPRYRDLVAFADFTAEKSPLIRIQLPLGGEWVNANVTEIEPSTVSPPGADNNPYGNAIDYPVFSVLPSGNPDVLLVYKDADFIGLFYRVGPNPDWRFTSESSVPASQATSVLKVGQSGDRITLTGPDDLLTEFGGGHGGQATLERPNVTWTGKPVDAANGFYTQGAINDQKVNFRTFNPASPDFSPLYFQAGHTGTNRHVFAEPDPSDEYRFDANASGKVVPFGFRLVKIERGQGSFSSHLVTDEQQLSVMNSFHVGASVDIESNNGFNMSAKSDLGMTFKTNSSSKVTNAYTIAKTFNRDFMMAINKSEVRLNPDFIDAVKGLRDAAGDPGGLREACDRFIADWGTHYPLAVTYGGMLIYTNEHTESEVKRALERGMKLEAEVKLGAAEEVTPLLKNKQTGGVGFGYQDETSSASARLEKNAHAAFYSVPSGQTLPGLGDAAPSLTYQEAVPLFLDLRPLSDLLSPLYFDDPVILHDVRAALRERTQAYFAAHEGTAPPQADERAWIVPPPAVGLGATTDGWNSPHAFVSGSDGVWTLCNGCQASGPYAWVRRDKPQQDVGVARGVGAVPRDGTPDLFVIGRDGSLYENAGKGQATTWKKLGQPSSATIDQPMGVTGGGTPYVFALGSDGNLWNCIADGGGTWVNRYRPSDRGVHIVDWMGTALHENGAPYVFVKCDDGNLWVCYNVGGQDFEWVNFNRPPGVDLVRSLGATMCGGTAKDMIFQKLGLGKAAAPQSPFVFVLGSDGNVWLMRSKEVSGGSWTNLGKPPGTTVGRALGAMTLDFNTPYLWCIGADGMLYALINGRNGRYFDWQNVGAPRGTWLLAPVGATFLDNNAPWIYAIDIHNHLCMANNAGGDHYDWFDMGDSHAPTLEEIARSIGATVTPDGQLVMPKDASFDDYTHAVQAKAAARRPVRPRPSFGAADDLRLSCNGDNRLELRLNGKVVAGPFPDWTRTNEASFSAKSGDVVEFVVENGGGPGGLVASWMYHGVTYGTDVPGTAITVESGGTIEEATHPWFTPDALQKRYPSGARWIWTADHCETCTHTFRWIVP